MLANYYKHAIMRIIFNAMPNSDCVNARPGCERIEILKTMLKDPQLLRHFDPLRYGAVIFRPQPVDLLIREIPDDFRR